MYNGISVTGDIVGTTVHIGRGAGQDATASAVISDVSDAVAALLGTSRAAIADREEKPGDRAVSALELASLSEVSGQYYVRLKVTDKPGVLAEVAAEMARHDVSIASVIQPKAKKGRSATLILTTHTSNEKSIQDTIRDLKDLKSVLKTPFLLRIADFDD